MLKNKNTYFLSIYLLINYLGVALGDLQSSVYALLKDPKDAVLNISTSAQLAYIHPTFKPKPNLELSKMSNLLTANTNFHIYLKNNKFLKIQVKLSTFPILMGNILRSLLH